MGTAETQRVFPGTGERVGRTVSLDVSDVDLARQFAARVADPRQETTIHVDGEMETGDVGPAP